MKFCKFQIRSTYFSFLGSAPRDEPTRWDGNLVAKEEVQKTQVFPKPRVSITKPRFYSEPFKNRGHLGSRYIYIYHNNKPLQKNTIIKLTSLDDSRFMSEILGFWLNSCPGCGKSLTCVLMSSRLPRLPIWALDRVTHEGLPHYQDGRNGRKSKVGPYNHINAVK